MRKCSETKSVAGKSGNKRGPRAKKDTALGPEGKKTVCRRKNVQKHTAIDTIVSLMKPEVGAKIAAPDRKEPLDIQKLLSADPEEPLKAVMRPEERLEKAAAKIEQQIRNYVETITGLEIALLKEKTGRIAAEEKARMYAEQLAQLQEKARTWPESEEKTGLCNCCGRTNIPEKELIKIDSGQRMCPTCLGELMGLTADDTAAN